MAHPSRPIVTYTRTGDIVVDDGYLVDTHVRGHLAVVLRSQASDTVRLDARSFVAGGRVTELNVSADGRHVSWLAAAEGGPRAYVDGRPGQAPARCTPVFLPEGGWAYTYHVGQRQRLLVNERPHGLFDRIEPLLVDSKFINADWNSERERGYRTFDEPRFWVGINERLRWLLTRDQRFGPYDQIDRVYLSGDQRHWACVVRANGRATMLWDGTLLSWHDQVLSPHEPTGDCCCGEGQSPFTLDGRHLVWQVRDGQREVAMVDERALPDADPNRRWQELLPTGDGSHLITASGFGDGVHYRVDGRPLSTHGDVSEVVVTGAGPAWAAVVGNAGRVFVATHLGDRGPFERVTQPVISQVRGTMVWAAKAEGVWRIWRDGQAGDPVPAPNPPRFGPRGILTYCQVGDGRRAAVWVNGRVGPWFDSVDEHPIFTADGQHIAYRAKVGQRTLAVLDHKVVATMSRVDHLRFSPGGRGLLVRGETGRYDLPWLAQAPLPDSAESMPNECSWSGDERHWAYLAGVRGRMFAVHDGHRQQPLQMGNLPAISPNGRHVVIEAMPLQGSEQQLLVDGQWLDVTFHNDRVGSFGPDGVYRHLVNRHGEMVLIEIRWRR